MKVLKKCEKRIKHREIWRIKILNDEGNQIGSIRIKKWGKSFCVHVHNWEEYQVTQKGYQEGTHIAIYPKLEAI